MVQPNIVKNIYWCDFRLNDANPNCVSFGVDWVINVGRYCTGCYYWGKEEKKGMADILPHHVKDPPGALIARRRHACSLQAHLTPACLEANIFFPTSNIGDRGWGRRGAGRLRQI